MKPLQFISTFAQIVVKGCMESKRAKAAILTAIVVISILFAPYLIGLIMVTESVVHAWLRGLGVLILISGIALTIGFIYSVIHNEIIK